MSEIFGWFDDWRGLTLRCRCGWSGALAGEQPEAFAELVHFECHACDEILVIVSYPTKDDIRSAARRGHPEALRMLESGVDNDRSRSPRYEN